MGMVVREEHAGDGVGAHHDESVDFVDGERDRAAYSTRRVGDFRCEVEHIDPPHPLSFLELAVQCVDLCEREASKLGMHALVGGGRTEDLGDDRVDKVPCVAWTLLLLLLVGV